LEIILMQSLLAIAGLTLKAAFRFRLVLVLIAILLSGVILLPLVIKDDGTARGFTQIILTYTLSLTTALLGFATLWLACGTLARDVEECQIQMVAVKPVARWQIWLGKWLGILALNALLLTLAAGAVFFLMRWRAHKLPPDQQAILRNEVMIARGSAKEPVPNIEEVVEVELKKRMKQSQVPLTDLDYMRKQIREQIKAVEQIVPPDHRRQWTIDLGFAKNYLRDQPLFLRVKFNTAQIMSARTYLGLWGIGEPNTARFYQTNLLMTADTFHELIVPPNLINEKGELTINFVNRNDDTPLLFPLEDGMEVLYREGSFGLNFIRGVGIIFCWLTLLATLGLAAASFLSFPVAAFLSVGVLIVGLSSGTIALVIEQGTVFEVNHETGVADQASPIDYVALPVFKVLLKVVNLVRGFSPIDSLSTGRSITWGELGLAFAQIILILSGLIGSIGMVIFTRRELAAAQSHY
jgi:ABC-type transport system involved in multi-copper enzyme maturation permease subunit